jgi:2-polyprenyl-6-methoxyphenol hydroxylase-like FAD-dependent oxidoreductase
MMVLIDRGDYWQAAFVAPKGVAAQLREGPVARIRDEVAELVPFLADRVAEIGAKQDLSLLEVRVDRLTRCHRPGLLLIGDAAHAMSPIGGIGINLAIQDAVATANALAERLRGDEPIPESALASIARRRAWPTRVVQWVQVTLQNRVIAPTLAGSSARPPRVPRWARWLLRFDAVRALPAWFFGQGVLQEHAGPSGRNGLFR